jgi:hypothetical protein
VARNPVGARAWTQGEVRRSHTIVSCLSFCLHAGYTNFLAQQTWRIVALAFLWSEKWP